MPEIRVPSAAEEATHWPRPAFRKATDRAASAPAQQRAEKRTPRKIRFTRDEWALVAARARDCGRAPARYVREVALGRVPKARRSRTNAELIRELGRIGNALTRLSATPAVAPHGDENALRKETLEVALGELLAAVRRID